jgi:hypothetical protein
MDLEKLLPIVPGWSLFVFDAELLELVEVGFSFELESVSTSSPACFPLETSICPSLSAPDPSFCVPIPPDLFPFPLIGRLLIGVGGMTVLENCFKFTIHKVHVQFESSMA